MKSVEAYYSLEVNYFINRDLFKEERRELRRIAQKLKKFIRVKM